MGGAAAATGVGAIGGLLGGQRTGGTSVGNIFLDDPTEKAKASQNAVQTFIDNRDTNYGTQQDEVANGRLTGQLFNNNGGVLSNAIGDLNNLRANPGLTSEDQTAYGQASGNIARLFGAQEQGTAQSLADRGLSNSGAAGAAFSGIQGNKNEQLAGLQTQIAQNRENLNMQKMNSMQNFITQMGNMQNQSIGQVIGLNQARANIGMDFLKAASGQANENLAQQQETSHQTGLSNAFTGAMGGLSALNSMAGKGGMFAKEGAYQGKLS